MVGMNRSNWRREPRPGFRWKAVRVPGARPGTFITQHVEVPIVGPETTSQVLAGMGGQEDRLGALAGADRVPPQDITTVIKEYEDDTPNTKTTTIKGGLLGDMYDKFDPYGGTATGGGMDDPNWSRATAVNTPRPTNLPGTDFFGGGVTAPNGERAAILEDRKRKFLEREALELAQRQKMREQTGGAAPSQEDVAASLQRYGDVRRSQFTPPPPMPDAGAVHQGMPAVGQPTPDPRFQRMMPGQDMGMVDPTWLGATAVNVPRPNNLPGTDFFGGGVTAPNTERAEILAARKQKFLEREAQELAARQKMREQTGGAAPTQAQVEESLGRYGDFRRNQLTPPTTPSYSDQELARMTPPPQADQRIEDLNEQEPRTDIGYELPRQVTEGGRIDTRPRGTMGRGGISQDIGKLPTGKDSKQDDSRQMEANPNLEKIWGKYAFDPKARRKFYLDNLKDIWRKALLMDVVANLTGGQSMSKRYLEMATGRLDAMEKFNEEDRISNIWKDVFTDANGNFYMPKNKREAAERAAKTGARPAVIKDIFGSVPDVKKKAQYHRVDPNDPTKWENKRFDPDEEPSEEWITGASRSASPDTEDIYTSRLNEWERLRGTNPRLAQAYGRMVGLVEKDPKGVSPSRWTSILQGDIQGSDPTIQLPEGETATSFIMKWLTNPEVEYVDPISGDPKKMPGYTALTGQKATKEEIAEATGATTATGDVTVDTSGEETRGEYEARVRKRYPNASEEDIQKTVRAKYG